MDVTTLQEKMMKDEVIVMDVRTKYEKDQTGEAAYMQSHIPGALFLDLKADLSGQDHFLPDPQTLAERLAGLGVTEDDHIVLYDQGNNRAASKGWVVFHYIGQARVSILQGGFPAWEQVNNRVTRETPTRKRATYTVKLRKNVIANLEEVKHQLESEAITLIDSRSYERYSGKKEPTYKKAGHIPGAVNYESQKIFKQDGTWKEKTALQTHFEMLRQDEKIVVSCGSGGSACMNFVALVEAGYEDIRLFPGGFSEWIEDDANEVAKQQDI